jgi:hypothetical protein
MRIVGRVTSWVVARDRNLSALRRATRAAIIMPALFALGSQVIGNATVATFAAFGSFAMLLLVDFTGSRAARVQAQLGLSVVGAGLVALGTVASRTTWSAVIGMTVVAFVVLFVGVVSSELAGATTALLLAFVLPVSLPGPVSSIPDRLAGWALASICALIAIVLLWPAPARDPLRSPAVAACRALAGRLEADVVRMRSGASADTAEHRDAVVAADVAVGALHTAFLATPYRPTGLSTAARMVVRLVDELRWVYVLVVAGGPRPSGVPANPQVGTVKLAAARVLTACARALDGTAVSTAEVAVAEGELRTALSALERAAATELPVRHDDAAVNEFLTALDPGFRVREIAFAITQVAANVQRAVDAERRSWWRRILGRPTGPLMSFQDRALAHLDWHSSWLHNSLRGAAGLGLAVLVADLTSVQHSFWVVLGALSVLRSNALSTGQNALRGLVGTVVGFAVGALLLWGVGTEHTLLWILLPPAVLVAGFAPAAVSFAAGQAAFTLALVILYNIIAPSGWQVGLLRVEDVALGCAVSLAVGLLFWPRGAVGALRHGLAEAYTDSAAYLVAAVRFGMGRCDISIGPAPAPSAEAGQAAAAARRLDDTFRTYLAERGAKGLGLADVSRLLTGVVGLRLAGDAVLDLWLADDCRADGERAAVQAELMNAAYRIQGWYVSFAAGLSGRGPVPIRLRHDRAAESRLIEAVRRDLSNSDGQASATAVRMVWTGDHLDAARRQQRDLVEPLTAGRAVPAGAPVWRWWRRPADRHP